MKLEHALPGLLIVCGSAVVSLGSNEMRSFMATWHEGGKMTWKTESESVAHGNPRKTMLWTLTSNTLFLSVWMCVFAIMGSTAEHHLQSVPKVPPKFR